MNSSSDTAASDWRENRHIKLLLIEDDDLLARSLIEDFKENGCCANLTTAIGVARLLMKTEDYALVMLNLGMSDGSGLSLLSR